MLVVIPFYNGDAWLAKKNIEHWISLDEKVNYPSLIVYDKETPQEKIDPVRELAKKYFTRVDEYNCGLPPSRKWPFASNYVFQRTVWHLIGLFNQRKIPKDHWIWVESDSVAMKSGWLNAINKRHIDGGKPFTGHWNYETQVWNGVSVYPHAPDINRFTHYMMLCENAPWDVIASKRDNISKNLQIANDLFQHVWADPATDAAYTFNSIEEVNSIVRESVMLFHRCKDGSLIDVLTEYAGNPTLEQDVKQPETIEISETESAVEPITITQPVEVKHKSLVVIPFCDKDYDCAMLNLKLARILDGKTPYEAIISYDTDSSIKHIRNVRAAANECFNCVDSFVYKPPRNLEWPRPQNHAWSKIAEYIKDRYECSWFWWEMDAVPLRKGWLNILMNEYGESGKQFMGYIVESMGHMNGVGFYPQDISKYVPTYNRLVKAFDVAIRAQTIAHTHKANHLFQNMWALNEDGVHILGKGKAPSFPTKESVENIIDFNKVIFHRCKDGTLAKRLIEKYE